MISATSEYRTSIDSITRSEWNDLLLKFDDATIYQSWDYGAVCWGEDQLSHLVLAQAGRPVGMAQVRLVRVPLIGKGIAYVRWGPLCQHNGQPWDEEIFRETMAALRDEYVERRGLVLRVIPNVFCGDESEASVRKCLEDGGFVHNPDIHTYQTMQVDLKATSEELRKRLDQKWRNQLNAAERNGLGVVEGTSDEFFGKFACTYSEMLARKRFETTVNIDEFGNMQRALPVNLKMRVLLAEREGKLMAGLVGAALGNTGIYLLGATSDEGSKAKGSYLLQWRLMQWLKERGCRWYDLGGVNRERNPGVYHFKSGLGGQEVRHLGAFELCADPLSGLCVASGEKLQKWTHSLKAVLKR